MAISAQPPPLSRTEEVLLTGRRDLWKVRLPVYLDPFREFVIDPSLKLWTIVLPPFANWMNADGIIADWITYTSMEPMRFFLRAVCSSNEDDARGAAKRLLLHPVAQPYRFKPPSDFASAIRGAFAFLFSASADLIGALINPKKMRKWLDAIGNFRAYLHVSGVGAELEESMMKPLLRGRLLDNIKMLHDIQKLQDNRVVRVKDDSLKGDMELEKGSAMMRFATAAYGAEMVKASIDREATVMELDDERKAIAFHTNIQPDDVKLLNVRDGGAMTTLRHYVAVDHKYKAVVLALRGTLSISGALIDMQAMDCSYCSGRAHQGIAEMADAVWKESGDFLTNLLQEEEYKDYDLIITGHSLGGGTACLLHVKLNVEGLVPNHRVLCYGFAPPPTFCWDAESKCDAIEDAMKHCVCYIHDNDCVPHLSVATIRRLATLLDTVDNFNEHVWFWRRGLVFWGWKPLPQELIDNVTRAQNNMDENNDQCTDCEMIIPAKVVVWCKKTNGKFDAIPCRPQTVSGLNIFMCEDMVTDHLPEQYEDALDALLMDADDVAAAHTDDDKKDQ